MVSWSDNKIIEMKDSSTADATNTHMKFERDIIEKLLETIDFTRFEKRKANIS